MNKSNSLLRPNIALPQDHGSWVFLLSPLLIGLFAGHRISMASFYLIIASLGAFVLRQPISIIVKVFSERRPRKDLNPAITWVLIYFGIIFLALAGLITNGYAYILYLLIPAVPIFTWHLYLVSKRAERKQAGVEILATGVLALSATAAFWIGQGYRDPVGWYLWLLTWMQSAASIVYAYLRLEQRTLEAEPDKNERWSLGRPALRFTSFNLGFSIALGWTAWLPQWIFIPYLLQWLETIWGINRPAIGWKPTRIGVRQLIVSTFFTILFIVFWRLR